MFRSKFVRPLVGIISSCVSEGQPIKGTELAPLVLSNMGLFKGLRKLGYTAYDQGTVKALENHPKHLPYNGVGLLNQKIREHAYTISQCREFMLNLGGDHSVALGSIHGLLETYGDDLKIIWVDAHPDCIQPELSTYKHYHGMPVSSLLGIMKYLRYLLYLLYLTRNTGGFEWITKKLKPENLVYLGIRDIEPDEVNLIKAFGIKAYTMYDVNELGIGEVMKQILKWSENKPLHLSFDIDAIDPRFAPATGTIARGGLTEREAHYIHAKLYDSTRLVGLDLVEINPTLELQEREVYFGDELLLGTPIKGTQTVALGFDLIMSAFGYRQL